jgi:hypothetical protein
MLTLMQLINMEGINKIALKEMLDQLFADCCTGEQDGEMCVEYLENTIGFDIQSETQRRAFARVIENGAFHSAFNID